ncbi:MAG: demethoxyubiquinone hydroxylase family protein [Chloroflexota bacterium]
MSGEHARLRANLQGEIDGVALYRALAQLEKNPDVKAVYQSMADTEARHAELWSEKLRAQGVERLPASPGWRTSTLIALARRFGPNFILPTVIAREQADSDKYAGQADAAMAGLAGDERQHARLFSAIGQASPDGMGGAAIAQYEGRHRGGGNALRAAVLGANDGLLSNASLVRGVAGAELAGRSILVTGLAGLLAGAISMALGEWLSVQSARELVQHQLQIEQAELETNPEEEAEELALIYRAKGVPEEQARELARRLVADSATALDTLAREELGADPAELGGSAWEAAITSFVLFAIGAIVPVLPFIFGAGQGALILSVSLSLLALFVIGAAITVITGKSVWFSGFRQVAFGVAAFAVTYLVGKLFGAQLGG